ncbi:MAG: glycosyl hydrolase, partial [Planctomycetota bacterium]
DALDAHFEQYIGALLKRVGPRQPGRGWTMLHIDSWEMGAQNWTAKFREEFRRRRGYDPLFFLPTYTGQIVGSLEMSERFLFDMRTTAQELVLENHAGRFKELGRRHGFGLSIEPYDMNPTADLDLGAVADVPMCEFWSDGFGFDTAYSCFEATSIAHTMGRPIVAAEAFTALSTEAFQQYPGSMKNQGDWAFCLGINRFVYHTFAHKPLGAAVRPGMTMGRFGVHWDRGQTWWPMVSEYHRYVSRCQYLLRQGTAVADILYLTPEGAPQVFRPPVSALVGDDMLPDRRGYGCDGCSPGILLDRAEVRDGRIVFKGGTSYRLLVLPAFKTMTPELLAGIELLVRAGATVVGSPPTSSPSLSGSPECNQAVREKARKLWGGLEPPDQGTAHPFGKGRIVSGGEYQVSAAVTAPSLVQELYPPYLATASLLEQMGVPEDFTATGPIRYTHRRTDSCDLYFVASKVDRQLEADCTFRVDHAAPELWDPQSGATRPLPNFTIRDGRTTIPMRFEPFQSFFVIFPRGGDEVASPAPGESNFPHAEELARLTGPWQVSFDPKWGGPASCTFDELADWSDSADPGIRYYSGTAVYRQSFDLPESPRPPGGGRQRLHLDLGQVKNLARVRLNSKDLGVVWTAPFSVEITDAVRPQDNQLEIEVVNLWVNRLIGDEQEPDRNVRELSFPGGLLGGKSWPAGRYTFAPARFYGQDSPLESSGLLGPVTLRTTIRSQSK